MALTKVKTKGITDANVTTAKTDLVSTASVAAVTAKELLELAMDMLH